MAETLLIKLAETIDDDSLPYLGEIRFKIKPFSSAGRDYEVNGNNQSIIINANEPIPMELTGDGHFTDSTLTQDLGKTYTMPAGSHTTYVSDGNSILKIRNKYAISDLRVTYGASVYNGHREHWSVDMKQFAHMKLLQRLDILSVILTGDLSVLNTLPALTYALIGQSNKTALAGSLTGDLSDISGLTNLTYISLVRNTKITGNIVSLAGLTNLTTLNLSTCSLVTGSTSSIAALHPNNGGKLANLTITGTKVTGTWPPA